MRARSGWEGLSASLMQRAAVLPASCTTLRTSSPTGPRLPSLYLYAPRAPSSVSPLFLPLFFPVRSTPGPQDSRPHSGPIFVYTVRPRCALPFCTSCTLSCTLPIYSDSDYWMATPAHRRRRAARAALDTDLLDASARADLDAVRTALAHGADPNASDEATGHTAVTCAIAGDRCGWFFIALEQDTEGHARAAGRTWTCRTRRSRCRAGSRC